jgi:hypothetical protein
VSLEEDFPGLTWEIGTLRRNGLSDDEITRAISDRAAFHQQVGYSNDAINAWLKGKPGPITTRVDPDKPLTARQMTDLQQYEKDRAGSNYQHEGGLFKALLQGSGNAGHTFAGEILNTIGATARTLKDEVLGSGEQFEHGVGEVFRSGASPLERVLGGAEAGLAFPRALMAVPTSVIRPTWQRGVVPGAEMLGVPKEVAENPYVGMIGEFALQLPFMGGLPKVVSAEQLGVREMESATRANEMTLARLRKLPVTDPRRKAMIDELARVHDMPSDIKGGAPEPPPPAEAKPTLVEASQSEKKVPVAKVETPEGEATVVDKTPEGETIVTKLPEDAPATIKKNLEEHTPKPGRAPTPEEMAEAGEPQAEEQASRGFTPEQAQIVASARVARLQGITREEAMKTLEGQSLTKLQTLAAMELREHRIAAGEITGRRGRPKAAESGTPGVSREMGGFDPALEAAPRETQGAFGEMQPEARTSLRETIRAKEVIMPADVGPKLTPADVGIPVYTQVRKIADSKGYELYTTKGKVYLLKDGGEHQEFPTLREANAFLMGKDAKPKQPVEIKSSGTEESAIESAMKGQKLTTEQQLNVKKQAAQIKNTPPLDMIGDTSRTKTDIVQPSERMRLVEGQTVGSVEDVGNQHQAVKALKEAEAQGLIGRMMKKPDGGFEVLYYKELTPDVSKATTLYRKVLSKGETALEPGETRFLGKMFGIPEEKIEEFVKDIHGPREMPPISGGAPTGYESFLQKVAGYIPGGSRIRFANPFAGGMISGSPLIRAATRALFWAERAFDFRMKGFTQMIENMKKLVPDIGRAQSLKEGSVQPASDEERRFLTNVQAITADFAERARGQGMSDLGKEMEHFAQDKGNMSSVWRAFRDEFSTYKTFRDMAPVLRAKLDPKNFQRFSDAFFRYSNVDNVPKPLLAEMKDKLFNMNDVVSQWDNLPGFVTSRLPREFFENFFLPKTGRGQRFGKDFYQDLQSYINRVESDINFQPWIKQYDPVIRQLPGGGVPFTERGFLETLANNAIYRRPSWDDKAFDAFVQRVNHAFGEEYLKVNDIHAVGQLARNGWLRGAIGPDSALKHIMGLWQTWAESGRVVGPMMKYIAKETRAKIPDGVLSDYTAQFGGDWLKTDKKALAWIQEKDRAFTHLVMSPETFIWNFTKGTSFFAGVEEAAAKGLDGLSMLQVGAARASRVVPNLQMTEQFMSGVEMAIKTQSGFTPASRAPLLAARSPLGRLSTMLLTWPTHLTQFMQLGLRQGFADAMMKQQYGKLMRYVGTIGFTFSLPWVMSKMGADVRNTWGPMHMLTLASFPFWSGILNAYHVATGKQPLEYEQNQRMLRDFVGTTFVPQWRFGGKVVDVVQNIERGFGVDQRGRYLYEASPYGELMRLVGVNPEQAYEARQLSHTLFELSHEYRRDKEDAIDKMLGGDMEAAQKYMSKWNRPITPQDLQRALQDRARPPEERALRGFPRPMRPMALEEAQR